MGRVRLIEAVSYQHACQTETTTSFLNRRKLDISGHEVKDLFWMGHFGTFWDILPYDFPSAVRSWLDNTCRDESSSGPNRASDHDDRSPELHPRSRDDGHEARKNKNKCEK